jgi:hypothetical protein
VATLISRYFVIDTRLSPEARIRPAHHLKISPCLLVLRAINCLRKILMRYSSICAPAQEYDLRMTPASMVGRTTRLVATAVFFALI